MLSIVCLTTISLLSCSALDVTLRECLWAERIEMSDSAINAMSRSERRQIARHNRNLQMQCE